MSLSEKINNIVLDLLSGTDKFLVDFVIQQGNKFSVYIDGDQGVTIEDCQLVSRTIESNVDREVEDYELTVSSAGLDHPLKCERQYRKNIGREMNIILLNGDKVDGILAGVTAQQIELEHPAKKPKKEIQKPNTIIPYTEIKSAKITIKIGK
jgi:ribosome maturation factor RimP